MPIIPTLLAASPLLGKLKKRFSRRPTPGPAGIPVGPMSTPSPQPSVQNMTPGQSPAPVQTPAPVQSVAPQQPVAPPSAPPAFAIQAAPQPLPQPAPQLDSPLLRPPTTQPLPQPTAPEQPAVPPQVQKAVESAETAVQVAQRISPEELSTQEDIDALLAEAARIQRSSDLGLQATSEQDIPLEFITGQQRAIENRALNQIRAVASKAEPLEAKLSRLQAQRTSSLESSKFALERADKRAEAERKAAEVKTGDPFTLGEGQVRFDPEGQEIARGPAKQVKAGEQATPQEVNAWSRLVATGQAKLSDVPSSIRSSVAAGVAQQPKAESPQAKRAIEQSDVALRSIENVLNNPALQSGAISRSIQSRVPGTEDFDLARTLDTVKALIGFDQLQQMREASPTGGALGQVSERELSFLQSVAGSLDIGQSTKVLQENLEKIKESFETLRLVNSPDGTSFEIEGTTYVKQGDQLIPEQDFKQVGADTNLGLLKQSIIQQESGGDYSAVGIPTRHGRALGRYQIIPKFHFKKVGLNPNSQADKQKFLKSPEIQDGLFRLIVDDLARRHNNDPVKIAAAYYGGQGGVDSLGTPAADRRPQGGRSPSINEYVGQVISRAYG